MNAHVRDCLVTGYESLTESLSLPDPDDRHVLAAAIRCGAAVIETYNVGDFPVECVQTFSVEAQHPDDFLTSLIDLAPARVCAAAKGHRASLKNPPKDVDAYPDALVRQQLPETVARFRDYAELI